MPGPHDDQTPCVPSHFVVRGLSQREEAATSCFWRCRSDGWSRFFRGSHRSRSFRSNAGSGTGWFTTGSATDVVAAGFPGADAFFANLLRRLLWRLDALAGCTVAHAKCGSEAGQQSAGFAAIAATSSAPSRWSAGTTGSTFAIRTAFTFRSTVATADSVTRAGVPRETSRWNADRLRFDVVAGRCDVDFFHNRFARGHAVSIGAAARRLAALVGHRDRRHGDADQSQRR